MVGRGRTGITGRLKNSRRVQKKRPREDDQRKKKRRFRRDWIGVEDRHTVKDTDFKEHIIPAQSTLCCICLCSYVGGFIKYLSAEENFLREVIEP